MKYFALLFVLLTGCQASYTPPEITAIAHAGGGIHGKRYTNSMEALNYNYKRGFELFEIDFIWTTDNQMACLHDWDRTPKWLLNYQDEKPLSLEQFNQLTNEELGLTPCNLERLNQWLKKHPNSYIVTDIKGSNMNGLTLISEQIDDFQHRVIPQIKQPEEFKLSRDLGYRTIIWTLYSFKGDNDAVVKHAQNLDLFAITMPPHRAKQGLGNQLKPLAVPTYVHTINDLKEARDYQNTYGLTSVYTDFLNMDLNE
jgi:glycerophosphoryl diester phosphodiesterase